MAPVTNNMAAANSGLRSKWGKASLIVTPIKPAGIVPTINSGITRRSLLSKLRIRRQNTTRIDPSVPACRMISSVGDSLSSPISAPRITKCPEELIGRNSAIPWTTARMMI